MVRGPSKIQSRGFTLLETVVAVLIMSIATSIAIPLVNNLTGVHLKTASQKMAGNVKYLFDRAILEGLYIRLVIDFSQNVYWSESTKDRFFLSQKPLDVKDGLVVVEEEDDEKDPFEDHDILFDNPENYKWQGWGDFADKFRKKKAQFGTYATELSSRTELPKGVAFFRVETESISGSASDGQVYIHFFPNGYVEKSAIHLANASDLENPDLLPEEIESYTVEINPLNGRSVIYNFFKELVEDSEDVEQI